MTKKLLFTFSLLLLTLFSFSQVTFSGNGNTGFGGTIGESTLLISDDGTTITFVLTKGLNDVLSNVLVLYIDSTIGGRNAIDTDVNDNADGLRTAISNGDSSGFNSNITFPSGFEADYAIALDQGFGGLWQIPASGAIGNNGLIYLDSINLNPTNNSSSATFSFDIDWSELGITNSDSFTFVGFYVSTTAYNSDEGFGGGISPGTVGNTPVTFTSALEYPSGNVLSDNLNDTNAPSTSFIKNRLFLNNLQGKIVVKVYDVLGKLIVDKGFMVNTNNHSITLDLPKNQLHILMVEGKNFIKVFKAISQ